MDQRSPVYQFISLSTRSDLIYCLYMPLVLSVILSVLFYFGRTVEVVGYLIDIVPVLSSIMLGFLGMILVASLSNNSIFEKMRTTELTMKDGSIVSAYRVFFVGLFADMLCFVLLLGISLTIGSLNQSFDFGPIIYIAETLIMLFLLLSSSMMFIRNMDRVYQVTIHLS